MKGMHGITDLAFQKCFMSSFPKPAADTLVIVSLLQEQDHPLYPVHPCKSIGLCFLSSRLGPPKLEVAATAGVPARHNPAMPALKAGDGAP